MDNVTPSTREATEEVSAEATAGVGGLTEAFTVDAAKVKAHVDEVVRDSVKQTLHALLDAEADRLAGRYEHTSDRQDTRAGRYRRRDKFDSAKGVGQPKSLTANRKIGRPDLRCRASVP